MRHVRGRSQLVAEKAVPIPAGWSFGMEQAQMQVSIGRKAMPKFKLMFDLLGRKILTPPPSSAFTAPELLIPKNLFLLTERFLRPPHTLRLCGEH